ncbi:hypothetical protein Barb4_00465 [Bacteroidales bacterium Barb4]|nr:hypothetical protein Barb4_00465 [Bacteroidales bacterium Barb4]
MNLFDVHPLFNIEIVKGKGCKVWDKEGDEYLLGYQQFATNASGQTGEGFGL